jgi:hypothetical protein
MVAVQFAASTAGEALTFLTTTLHARALWIPPCFQFGEF